MFKRADTREGEKLVFDFEGAEIVARSGDTVAAALLAAGVNSFRETPQGGRRRGPFCMMGVCFDCLMVIDGEPNSQACQVMVRDGMSVTRQQGAAAIVPDSEAQP